jgi:hypothetical protein
VTSVFRGVRSSNSLADLKQPIISVRVLNWPHISFHDASASCTKKPRTISRLIA